MTSKDGQNMVETTLGTTRRKAMQVGGSAALAALVASGLRGRSGAAQEATPVAAEGLAGKYVVVRLRKLNAGHTVDEVNATIDAGFVPLVETISGFIAYFGSGNPDTGDMIYVGVYADKTGADESTKRGGEWLTENSYDFFVGDPIVIEGVIDVEAEAGGLS